MRLLVTGGAGYIGSITAQLLLDHGHAVSVLDDLRTGHRGALPEDAKFFEGPVQDATLLDRALEGCEAVIHFASLSLVGESMERPDYYMRENVGAMEALLAGMRRCEVGGIVFSSSAAVYGEPEVDTLDEHQPLRPINPYGRSKVAAEELLSAESEARALAAISLRYFNACGASGGRGEDHSPETHLIPRICAHLLGRLPEFAIFGDDFPTPDGTAVRDYIHVEDLARAHLLAVERLERGVHHRVNLGTGNGSSVGEIVAAASRVAGKELTVQRGPRRAGDPARLVASRQLAESLLGWSPRRSDPDAILRDAWDWHCSHPEGYGD